MELDGELSSCYYASGNYDADLHSGASGVVMSRIERLMERPFTARHHFPLTVEVGSGSGGHLRHVRHSYDQYLMTDIRDYGRSTGNDPRTPFLLADAEMLPLADGSVDRLISTCLLHHVTNPLVAVSQWRNALRPGGSLTIFLSCDPGLLWRFGRRVGPRRRSPKDGADYDFLMALMHRNHAGSLMAILDKVFAPDQVQRTGFPIPVLRSWNLNIAFVYHVTKAGPEVSTSVT